MEKTRADALPNQDRSSKTMYGMRIFRPRLLRTFETLTHSFIRGVAAGEISLQLDEEAVASLPISITTTTPASYLLGATGRPTSFAGGTNQRSFHSARDRCPRGII